MKRKLPILLLILLFLLLSSPALADSAVYHVANFPVEDTYGSWGASSTNGYNVVYGWQYFGYAGSTKCYYNAYWRWAIDIPKGSTITSAYVRIRADYTNSGSLNAAFSALAPDNRWNSSNGFAVTNYAAGTDLNNIPRQGVAVPWNNLPTWTMGTRYLSPDISGLVQARIENADYDPLDERGKYFGLALEYVSGSGYRVGTQEPDDDSFTAELYVEWTPGPPPPPPTDTSAVFSVAASPEEDTFASVGALDQNGYNNAYGWQYFGYATSTSCWYSAYWRWALTIPPGSTITRAYVKIRSDYTNDGYLDAAFGALVPDGKWENGSGFSIVNYSNGSALNAIPRQGPAVPWNDIPGWTAGTWFYSPDITALVQDRVDNADYDPESSEGRYFGLVLYHVSGTRYRTATQQPDQSAYAAQLFVSWGPPSDGCDPNAVEICGDGIDNNCNGEVDELCNACPVADAGLDLTPHVGETVQLDGSASTDVDGDSLSYNWTIIAKPAGSLAVLSDAAAVRPSIVIDSPGEYTVELVVSDGQCESNADTVVLSTLNTCPVADAGPDQSLHIGETVVLDGGASSDVDGDQLEYQWSIAAAPEGSTATLSASTGQTVSFTPDVAGEYSVELRVNDDECQSNPDTVRVSTENLPPVADAGLDQQGGVGQAIQLDGEGSFDPDGDQLYFFWSVLSEPFNYLSAMAPTTGDASLLSDPTSPVPHLNPTIEGDYVVQLVVSDGYAESEPDTCVVTVVFPDYVCPAGHGFWANHLSDWPVEELALGSVVYAKEDLVRLLKAPVRGDASLILAKQLAAAKLNLNNGSEPQPIVDAVVSADELLGGFSGTLPYHVKPSAPVGRQMTELATTLAQYNQGLLTTDCVDW